MDQRQQHDEVGEVEAVGDFTEPSRGPAEQHFANLGRIESEDDEERCADSGEPVNGRLYVEIFSERGVDGELLAGVGVNKERKKYQQIFCVARQFREPLANLPRIVEDADAGHEERAVVQRRQVGREQREPWREDDAADRKQKRDREQTYGLDGERNCAKGREDKRNSHLVNQRPDGRIEAIGVERAQKRDVLQNV